MTGKIIRSSFSLALLVLLAGACLFSGILYSYYEKQSFASLSQEALQIRQTLEYIAPDQIRSSDRVTLIASDGTVLYDSVAKAADMDNHLSREEVAKKLGKSPSAIANKLRILKLPPEVLEGLRREGLSERHGRALLRLEEREAQLEVFEQIVRRGLTVAATEALIDRMLTEKQKAARRSKFILKDVRVFLNTLNRGLELMQRGGINADLRREDREDALVLTISIPRRRAD